MKVRVWFSVLFLCLASLAFAQKSEQSIRTIINPNGGFSPQFFADVGLDASFLNFGNAFVMGSVGALKLNQSVSVGVAMGGLAGFAQYPIQDFPDAKINFNYFGVFTEKIIFPLKPIRYGLKLNAGFGAAMVADHVDYSLLRHQSPWAEPDQINLIESQSFMYVEPSFLTIFALTRHFSLGINFKYRLTNLNNIAGKGSQPIDGFSLGLSALLGNY